MKCFYQEVIFMLRYHNMNVILYNHILFMNTVKCDKTFIDLKALEPSRLNKPTSTCKLWFKRVLLWHNSGNFHRNPIEQLYPTPGLLRNLASQQEVKGRPASEASSAAPHRSNYSLNHPPSPTPRSVETFSSAKPVPGAKMLGTTAIERHLLHVKSMWFKKNKVNTDTVWTTY